MLLGARQVGKTYLLKQFGASEFSKFHYFNFEEMPPLKEIFEDDFNIERILTDLSIHGSHKINIETDLIIFDEIQSCPKALNSLKYFNERFSKLYLCCAGSLLGVSLSTESFTVGQVEFHSLHPLSFEEFLWAQEDSLIETVWQDAISLKKISPTAHQKLLELLHTYYFTGGMPAAVNKYLKHHSDKYTALIEVRKSQKNILESYYKDFAKHSGKLNSMHINLVFENVPMQLAHNIDSSVQRYKFKDVLPKKKGLADLEGPISWLEKANLIIKVSQCNRAEIPIKAFCSNNLFKLYYFDIGLLGCTLEIPPETILNMSFGIEKGYFVENFVTQQLRFSKTDGLYSWQEGKSEIEFLEVFKGEVVPVEVKSANRVHAKSLKEYIKKYNPKKAIKLSENQLCLDEKNIVKNIPLYLTEYLDRVSAI